MRIFALALLSATALAQSDPTYENGQFCQFDSECISGCCTSSYVCEDINSCPILQQIQNYESKNYCTLDS